METETPAQLIQHSTFPESSYPFAKTQEQMGDLYNKDNNDLLSALEGLKFENEEKKAEKESMNIEDNELDYEDMEDDDEMEEVSFDEEEIFGNKDE